MRNSNAIMTHFIVICGKTFGKLVWNASKYEHTSPQHTRQTMLLKTIAILLILCKSDLDRD